MTSLAGCNSIDCSQICKKFVVFDLLFIGKKIHESKNKNKLLFLQLSRGANMERRSGLGYTPIHVTAHYDRVGVARLLLEAGVNPDEEDLQVSWFLLAQTSTH